MKQAIFLVTSLAGIKKLTFKQKITMLRNDDIQITVVLGMVQFDEYEAAKQLIQTMVGAGRVIVMSLAELVRDKPGIAVAEKDQFTADYRDLDVKRFSAGDNTDDVILRYVAEGDIVAEEVVDADGRLITATKISQNQPVAAAVYEDDKQIGLLHYTDGKHDESLLLNGAGELVYRFIRHDHHVTYDYEMQRTSKMAFTNLISETDEKTDQVSYRLSEERPYYEVVDHVDFHRFNSIFEFYAEFISTEFADVPASLFIDLNDNPHFAAYLQQLLIFNY
ncbi:hypothetical protein [Secundilactobacillus paracollinoides]|uniref:Uncharacterized protein n=1 Tax=Secundilactobacillus paracollinoides TaxID=240427 RepID=A0A1B2J1U6_9LACO|nr:hypothetical protein [Secundilactobacillus paracollinoides]ANZ62319.1 hypothetical protein AYR61_13935 [Secundilactobacillus paracollinoides]ANZ68267.1 hypothetical protein AYR63_14810 [Secundilactobacillus paracollinoides]KRL78985.1 hypothetical protein FC17_GL000776 [Secundilactobacillus paracollinoides DSM 15502 = JCM 11969]